MTLAGVALGSPLQMTLVALVVFLGGFMRGFAGFGSALVIIPGLALLYEPKSAVVMHAFMEIPTVLTLLPAAVRDSDKRTVRPMIAVLILTTPLGALILKAIDQDTLKIVIALLVLAMVGLIAQENSVAARIGRRGAVFAGALGGVIQGAAGVGGPPVVTSLMAQGSASHVARGNVIAVMSSLIIMSIAVFSLYGLVTPPILLVAAICAPICFVGALVGSAMFRRYGARSFKGVALVFLAATAISILAAATSSDA